MLWGKLSFSSDYFHGSSRVNKPVTEPGEKVTDYISENRLVVWADFHSDLAHYEKVDDESWKAVVFNLSVAGASIIRVSVLIENVWGLNVKALTNVINDKKCQDIIPTQVCIIRVTEFSRAVGCRAARQHRRLSGTVGLQDFSLTFHPVLGSS